MPAELSVRYEGPSGLEWTRMATGPEVTAAVVAVATKGKLHAEELALEFSETGRYRQAFRVDTGTIRFAGRRRAYANIVNDVPYAAVVELRHQVLSRTRDYLQAR